MKKFNHIMVDLETMGKKSYSAIVSLAAVKFELETGEIGDQIHYHISLDTCVKLGMSMDTSTVMWWLKQSDAARNQLTEGKPIHIAQALEMFMEFIHRDGGEPFLWSNSAKFDLGILQNAYNLCGMDEPWDFHNERDVRTLVALVPDSRAKHIPVGTEHNALDDCKNQIAWCYNAMKLLRLVI